MQQNKLKRGGFTLTEVMIGIMILTVAIVSATNLLIGLVQTNRNNLTTMQAYYLAQEGLEAVRNIRDTNWLNNTDWLAPEGDKKIGDGFKVGSDYSVALVKSTDDFAGSKPWSVEVLTSPDLAKGILKNSDPLYLSSEVSSVNENVAGVDAGGFKRVISIQDYDCKKLEVQEADFAPCVEPEDPNLKKYVLVQSTVSWNIGSKQRDVTLYSVLSNWKGGAL